ncbi:MAG: AraC family transcriptional regulator [Victivallaceae bacterium]|nr:AraC family transcriptional regulator [Victivallaceae bacterium]
MEQIDFDIPDCRQLRVETVRTIRLGSFWDGILLSGGFWRIYHNQDSGAAIRTASGQIDLQPDRLYFVAPYSELTGFCRSTPLQLYIHYELPGIGGVPDRPVLSIPLTGTLHDDVTALERSLTDNTDATFRQTLLAMRIVATAMGLLPDNALVRLSEDSRIVKICDLMRSTPGASFSLPELAANTGLTPNAFLRKFRAVTGGTPYQYLLSLRYSQAARLLTTTELPIKEICDLIGVSDRFHFSRTFKRIFGISPGAYRKETE